MPTRIDIRMHWATYDPTVQEVCIVVSEYRHVGEGGYASHRRISFVGNTCGIDIHQKEEDRGTRRQHSDLFQNIREGHIVRPYERQAVCKLRILLAKDL